METDPKKNDKLVYLVGKQIILTFVQHLLDNKLNDSEIEDLKTKFKSENFVDANPGLQINSNDNSRSLIVTIDICNSDYNSGEQISNALNFVNNDKQKMLEIQKHISFLVFVVRTSYKIFINDSKYSHLFTSGYLSDSLHVDVDKTTLYSDKNDLFRLGVFTRQEIIKENNQILK